jgi:hypothetical protein
MRNSVRGTAADARTELLTMGRARMICNERIRLAGNSLFRIFSERLTKWSLSLDVVTALCSSCSSVNLLPGFTKIDAFICRKGGASNA